ncbi:YcdB/YcdC domain-containing protein, partial [Leifsonia sp. SIMBA_070]
GTEYTWAGADKTITAQISPNGLLTAYHVQETGDETTGTKRAPREDDQKKAINYLQRYLDKQITAVGYLGSSWNEREIQYTFGAFVDGIPLKG